MKLSYYYFKQLLMRFSSVWMAMMLISTVAFAQRTVTGSVTDASTGDPVQGAAVLIKGTTVGAYTDQDGNYTVSVPSDGTVLIFSYFGFSTMEREIGDANVIDVALEQSVGTLDEVIVTGYTTQREEEKTSAIVSVKADDFNGGNVPNPAQLIQGKVAGLTIARPGGDPNGNFDIRLRGLGSLGANSSPLIIIDGVLNADLNTVDPNDIASFDVLKDGSAAAIYGTQAAAGVIIITTKKGLPGSSSVEYNGFYTADYVGNTIEVLDRDQFLSFPAANDLGSNTDWFDELTQVGNTQVHNISLSGGTNSTTYRASVNLRDQEGIAIGTGFNQLNGRLNLQQKALNDRLTINFNVTATLRDEDRIIDEAFRQATIYNPTAPVRSSDPEFDIYDGYFQQLLFNYSNPVALAEQNTREAKFNRILGSLDGKLEILPGLVAGVRYSQQRNNQLFGNYSSKFSLGTGRDRNGLAERRTEQNFFQLFETTLAYETDFGDLSFSALAGYSYQEFVNEGFRAQGGNLLTEAFTFNNLGAAADFENGLGTIESFQNSNKLIAGFGRVELGYEDTYYLSAVLRREGSTQFGNENKWGFFPGISGAVTLSNLFTLPGLDFLKLRGGYGVTGARPPESYLSLFTLRQDGNFFFNGNFIPAYNPFRNANTELQWEEKQDLSIGIDFSLLNYRLNGSLDFYNSTTVDAILDLTVPVPPNFADRTWANIGEISQSGLEATLGYQVLDGENLSWETNFAFTYYLDNTLDVLTGEGDREISALGAPGQSGTPLLLAQEGESIGQLYGLVFDGISSDGTWQFADVDGDGAIDELKDRDIIGQALPDWQLGWNNTFNFGNFDLNFFFRGVFGHQLINTFRAFYEAPQSLSSYNAPATITDVRNLTDGPKFSSYHVEDASFITLDNATLGYTVPLANKDWLTRLRVYVAGQNLFLITDYSGADPEVRLRDNNGGLLAPGIDRRNTYFRTSGITFGVNVGL